MCFLFSEAQISNSLTKYLYSQNYKLFTFFDKKKKKLEDLIKIIGKIRGLRIGYDLINVYRVYVAVIKYVVFPTLTRLKQQYFWFSSRKFLPSCHQTRSLFHVFNIKMKKKVFEKKKKPNLKF